MHVFIFNYTQTPKNNAIGVRTTTKNIGKLLIPNGVF